MNDELDVDARLVVGEPTSLEQIRLSHAIVMDAAIDFIDRRGLAELRRPGVRGDVQ